MSFYTDPKFHIHNPWLRGDDLPTDSHEIERPILKKIAPNLSEKLLTLEGPRQVGKSRLIRQVQRSLLKSGISPKHLLHIECQDSAYNYPAIISDIITYFEKELGNLRQLSQPVYIFLDELTHLGNWAEEMKSLVDMRLPINLLAASSSTTRLTKGARETLAGRHIPLRVYPFTLYEWALIKNKNAAFFKTCYDLLRELNPLEAPEKLASGLKYPPQEAPMEMLTSEMRAYLVEGGFPGYIRASQIEKPIYFQINVFDKVAEDLCELAGKRDIALVKSILNLVTLYSGQEINTTLFASGIPGAKQQTVSNYLRDIEQTYLVAFLNKNYPSLMSREKAQKKAMVIDPGIVSARHGYIPPRMPAEDFFGRLAESCAYNMLSQLNEHCGDITFMPVKSGARKIGEIDFIVEHHNKKIPVEVKYQAQIQPSDVTHLKKFIGLPESPFGICVTRDSLKWEDDILFLPLFILAA